MRLFRDLPIKQKLLLLMVLASTVTLLVAGTAIVLVEFFTSRAHARIELAGIAEAIEHHEAVPLALGGPAEAGRVAEEMSAHPTVASAGIFDRTGNVLAFYRRTGAEGAPLPTAPLAEGQGLERGYLYLSRPLFHRGKPIGTLYLSMDLAEVDERVRLYARIVLTVLIGAGLVSFLTAAAVRRLVARPVLELSAAASAVAGGDLQTRVRVESRDEVGRLGQAFNRMTERLAESYESLEHRVQARTRELADANAALQKEVAERRRAEAALLNEQQVLAQSQQQIQADLSIAREFQLAFLPQKFPSIPPGLRPEDSALRFTSRYRPSGTVGGDFYDILPLSDTTAGVLICDVMGHGVRAALVTAIVRALVAELKPIAADPGFLITEINRALIEVLQQTDSTIFATVFYMVADTASGRLRYACAGHPRPFHLRRNAGAVVPLEVAAGGAGPVLGLFAQSEFHTGETALEANDTVMLYTDGVYEVAGAEGDYGKERLLAAVRQRVRLPTARLFDEVLEEIQRYAPRAEFTDDVCLVGLDIARTGYPAA